MTEGATPPTPEKYAGPPSPLRWRLWWRFGFGPIIRLLDLLPLAEWRREQWVWRLDTWAMDHIGGRAR